MKPHKTVASSTNPAILVARNRTTNSGIFYTMGMNSLLTTDTIFHHVDVDSKKRLLEYISQKVTDIEPTLSCAEVFDALLSRERLGSTGIGHGVAIPHCRLPNLNEAIGLLLILEKSIKFDAIDQQPVDIVFGLLVPEKATEQHLELLAEVAATLDQAEIRAQLRHSSSPEQILQLMMASHD